LAYLAVCLPSAVFGLNTEWSAVLLAAVTAFVTALVAAPIRLAVDKRLQRSQVEIEYEHEQRKALREKIGLYHGRLLEAALDLNYRLVNLCVNWEQGWLDVGGDFQAAPPAHHYLRSTAFRFIRLAGVADRFERTAIVVDARIAAQTDQAFVRYPKAFRWVMTDVALFKGLEYDPSKTTDHFFNEQLRQMCGLAWGSAEELEFTAFEKLVVSTEDLNELFEFFEGIKPGQLRWDRLMSLHLLLMAFINTFGYDFQRSDARWFDQVIEKIDHREVVEALRIWIPKLGLGEDKGTKELVAALDRGLSP